MPQSSTFEEIRSFVVVLLCLAGAGFVLALLVRGH